MTHKRLGQAKVQGHPATAELFRLMVERVQDYAIFLLDPEGNVVSWNEGLQRIKGYAADEIIGRHISIFYLPEDVKDNLPLRLLETARSAGHVENEGWRIRKDGTRFWANIIITALQDEHGKLRGFGKVTRDLTERKANQDALSQLAGRLVRLQDEERKRVGRELHDTTSPLLTSLTGKLYSVSQRARFNYPELAASLEEALTLTETTATMVRTMASVLHPPVLANGGLVPALRWCATTFASKTGLRVDLALADLVFRMPRECEFVLFRVAEETLRAAKGAGGSAVRIQLGSTHHQVTLQVDAVGDWSTAIEDLRMGRGETGTIFSGMREWIRQLAGNLEMIPTSSKLTVRVGIPIA